MTKCTGNAHWCSYEMTMVAGTYSTSQAHSTCTTQYSCLIEGVTCLSQDSKHRSWQISANRECGPHSHPTASRPASTALHAGRSLSQAVHRPHPVCAAQLRQKNVQPALLWARQHAQELAEADHRFSGPGLQFQLHQLAFLQCLASQGLAPVHQTGMIIWLHRISGQAQRVAVKGSLCARL